jgi:NlpC/P60 family putative phage cell wall peptidase
MITREEIVAQARTWVGTPWHHQGRLKHAGVDCIGLIVGVCNELGLLVEDRTDYARFPDGRSLEQELSRQLVPAGAPLPGDVILFSISRLPQHVGFSSPVGLIHAHQGSKTVVETVLSERWKSRIVGVFTLPGVN